MYKELKCMIPTAAAFGGAILGLLSDESPSLQISQVLSAVAPVFLWPLRSFTAVSYLLFFVPFALIPNGLMNIILVIDCEIGMHEAGGPEMAAFQDLL